MIDLTTKTATIEDYKINRSQIMKTAWTLVKVLKMSLKQALTEAWKKEKDRLSRVWNRLTAAQKQTINSNKVRKPIIVETVKFTENDENWLRKFYKSNEYKGD